MPPHSLPFPQRKKEPVFLPKKLHSSGEQRRIPNRIDAIIITLTDLDTEEVTTGEDMDVEEEVVEHMEEDIEDGGIGDELEIVEKLPTMPRPSPKKLPR